MILSSVPVSLLRQYCFCPRIPYFLLVKGIQPVETPWMKQGESYHEKQTLLNKRRSFERYGLDGNIRIEHRVSLRSELLRLHGICDAMLFKDDQPMAIVEFKSRVKTKLNMGEIIQMAAYSMICEVEFGRQFSFGYILSGDKGKVKPVSINPETKLKVLQVRDALIAQCEECLLPDSSASILQCGQCEYLNYCADRL